MHVKRALVFTMQSLKRTHSRKRPALATTTFSNFRGGRLRELRLYTFICTTVKCNLDCSTNKKLPLAVFETISNYVVTLVKLNPNLFLCRNTRGQIGKPVFFT